MFTPPESHTSMPVLPPFPLCVDFLPWSSLLVCNNIADFTGRPQEEFLVFGEPESLQCDFRHGGQQSLITWLWQSQCERMCMCVHWRFVCFPSHVLSSANKSYVLVGKEYWECQQQWKGNACCVVLPLSVSYFLVLRYDLWHVSFLHGALAACQGPTSGWLCGPQATSFTAASCPDLFSGQNDLHLFRASTFLLIFPDVRMSDKVFTFCLLSQEWPGTSLTRSW